MTAPMTTGAGPQTGAASPESQPRLASRHIPALDGARGIAIALVLAYHFGIGPIPGGFLGVDLFFVLSGFLITSLLLDEHGDAGTISLSRFWLRRARRLLPALIVLLAVVALWATTISPYDKGGLRWDLLASLGYVANWRFIAEGQSYFQQFGTPSPVKHLWSLAIEEQFYVLWPLLVFVALGFAARRPARRAIVLGILVAAIAASVAAMVVLYVPADPSNAYYSTLSRAHELLVGAVAAVLVRDIRVRSALARGRGALGVIGVIGVAAFALLMSDANPAYYFGGSFAFAVFAGVLVVVAGTAGPDTQVARLLGIKPLVLLGVASYGIYLWHWPVSIWLSRDTTGLDGVPLLALRLGVTFLVALVSFVVVERPIRRGRVRGIHLGGHQVFVGASIAIVAVAAITVVTTRGAKAMPPFVANNRALLTTASSDDQRYVGLVGDSVAMSLYPGVAYQAGKSGLATIAATFPGCPVGTELRADAGGKPPAWGSTCPRAALAGQNELARQLVRNVFWLSSNERQGIITPAGVAEPGTDEWRRLQFADWDKSLARLTSKGAKVWLILPLRFESRNQGDGLPMATLDAAYREWAAGHPTDVQVLDLNSAICPSGEACPKSYGGVDLRTDGVHLTAEGAVVVAGLLQELAPEAFR